MQMWVKELIKQYSKGKRELETYRASLICDNPEEQTEEKRIEIAAVGGMISDMQYAIDWMRSGRRPYSRRGIDIKDAYSRAILMDMDLLPIPALEQELSVTHQQKSELVQVLLRLSARERQCYLLHMAQGLSIAEIGKELKLSKRTVQDYVERAKKKIPAAL